MTAAVSPTQLPGLSQITLPTPFKIGDVNAFVLEGDPLTLIDCGVNTSESFAILESGLGELGHSIQEIGTLIISHHHVDHLGGVQHVVQAASPEVVAHPYSVPYLEMPHAVRERNRNFMDVAFRQGGVPQSVIDVLDEVDAYLDSMMGTAVVAHTLEDGDIVSMGGCEWQVLHTPGHAGGMICFYEPQSGVALTSDHLLKHVSSNPLIEAPEPGQKRPRRLLDYIHSMERIAALNPAIAYTGHGDPITDVRALVAERIEHHRERADKVLALLAEEPRSLYEVSRLLFPRVPDREAYLTLSEALGHLDILESDGRIVRDMRSNGVLYWQPVS